MKIVAEDKAVESRTNDFLGDWERSKPIEGSTRPDDALQQLQLFESKFSRLKEERDNVSKAKEALELQEPGIYLFIYFDNLYCGIMLYHQENIKIKNGSNMLFFFLYDE